IRGGRVKTDTAQIGAASDRRTVVNQEGRTFLDALFMTKPDELYILIWTLPDKSSYWFRDVEKAASHLESIRGRDVYVGVGLSPADFGPSQRCVSEEVAGIVGFWADFDLTRSHKTKKGAMPFSEAVLRDPVWLENVCGNSSSG